MVNPIVHLRRLSRWSVLGALSATCLVQCALDERALPVEPTDSAGGNATAGTAATAGSALSGAGGLRGNTGGDSGTGADAGMSTEAGAAGETSNAACEPACDHGVCRTSQQGAKCACQSGFSGPTCATNIDDCSSKPCQNSGTCQDGIAAYTCQCPSAFTGQNCELPRFELVTAPRALTSNAVAASADVNVVVGYVSFETDASESCATLAQSLGDGGAGEGGASGEQTPCAYRWTHTEGLRVLPPLKDDVTATANAVSADGTVVVGFSDAGGQLTSGNRYTAVRWVGNGAPESLGVLVGDTDSQATNVSADGKAVLVSSSGGAASHSARWTTQSGLVALGTTAVNFTATAINNDGSTIVGNSDTGAFRWLDGTPPELQALAPLVAGGGSQASAVSADGKSVAGSVSGTNGTQPVLWVDGGPAQQLDSTGQASHPSGMSADGSVVFGTRVISANSPYAWSKSTGTVFLPSLAGTQVFSGPGVSNADGTVLGGGCSYPIEPAIWSQNAVYSIRSLLKDAGIDLTVRSFFPATTNLILVGMSADGSVVAGRGISNDATYTGLHAWVARLPPLH